MPQPGASSAQRNDWIRNRENAAVAQRGRADFARMFSDCCVGD